MNKLSDTEYNALRKRVEAGKEYLANRWGSSLQDDRDNVHLWKSLSNQLLEQMELRGMFSYVPSMEEELASAEARVERVRAKLIEKGYIIPKKERRKRNVHTGPESRSLFASS